MASPNQKRWSDIIPPENFSRVQLDRRYPYIHRLYHDAFGPEKTPLQVSLDTMRATGRAAIMDVGCGTGTTLRTWKDL